MAEPLQITLTMFGLESPIPDWSEALGLASAIAHTAVSAAIDREGQTYNAVGLEGEEAIDSLYHFAIDIVVPGHSDLEVKALGHEARLDLRIGERARAVHGIVTDVEVVDSVNHGGELALVYRIRLGPRAHLLTLRRTSRAFQGVTVKHVIEELVRPYLIPVHFQLRTELPERPYLCQVDETDFDFIRRIATDHGMFLLFEQPASFEEAALDAGLNAALGAISTGRVDAGGLSALFSGRPREVMIFGDHAAAYPSMTYDHGHISARRLIARAAAAVVNLGSPAVTGALHEAGAAGEIVHEGLTEAVGAGLHALEEAPHLRYRLATGGGGIDERVVESFKRRRRLRPRVATLREYDPRRPHATVDHHAEAHHEGIEGIVHRGVELLGQARGGHGEAGRGGGATHGAAGHGGAGRGREGGASDATETDQRHHDKYEHKPYEVFGHAGHQLHPVWEYDEHRPDRMLRHERAEHDVAHAEGPCPWFTAGHRFHLVEHPVERLNGDYAAMHVRHHASRVEGHGLHYENHAECVDAHHAHLSAFARPHVSTVITATVVGGGAVDTERMGQVKVRFHWDRARGQGASSCWLRVMQPWAGSGWGFQFLPRVGTEVVVGFEAGNPDRPMVLGGVYHAAQPWPFPLPPSSTKSGIKTRSIPHGDSGNELSFEDESDRELFYLHATKDLQAEVRHDRLVSVGHDDRLHVTGTRQVNIDGASQVTTQGENAVRAEGGYAESVSGRRQIAVTGTSTVSVDGDHHHRVTGHERTEVEGRRQVSVTGDAIFRTAGNQVLVVGSSDAPRSMATHVEGSWRSHASKRIEITADEELVLRVGSTTLRLSPDQAELSADSLVLRGAGVRALLAEESCKILADDTVQVKAQTVLLNASGAAVGLTSEAAIDGSRILLNSPENADDGVEETSREPTLIELTDDRGEPIPHQAYRIVLADGREIGGTLDENGRAELHLTEGGDIFFPGLRDVQEA